MKKILKPLIIAASVACVAGIGAVSYAAWAGSTGGDVTATGNSTGAVTSVAWKDNNPELTISGTNLVPVDQGTGTVILTAAIPTFVATDAYTITVSLENNNLVEGKLYVKIADAAVTAPDMSSLEDHDNETVVTALGSDWKEINGTDSVLAVTSGVAANTEVDKYIGIVLVSNSLKDMNKTFDVKVTIS